ncbi:hypothetical protein BJ912DRAFT_931465 [Pholiota molesta]|nr:hypothetical protein BJ912DRAFT_931465 [Pholiota molesta]
MDISFESSTALCAEDEVRMFVAVRILRTVWTARLEDIADYLYPVAQALHATRRYPVSGSPVSQTDSKYNASGDLEQARNIAIAILNYILQLLLSTLGDITDYLHPVAQGHSMPPDGTLCLDPRLANRFEMQRQRRSRKSTGRFGSGWTHIEEKALEMPFPRILRYFAQGNMGLGYQTLDRGDLGARSGLRVGDAHFSENVFASAIQIR